MNTLDEVITVFETGMLISDKPVNEAFREFNSDALHYLKEYRSDKAMWEADRKGYLDWIEQYKEACEKHQQAVIKLKLKEKEVNEILTDYVALKQWWAEQQENPPLTWQELELMDIGSSLICFRRLAERSIVLRKATNIGKKT